jgi:hypothetical protein
MSNKRYYPLIDEIKYHVFNWATEEEWKKLPRNINVALTTLMNELKIQESLQKAGTLSNNNEDEGNEKSNRNAFIAFFKRKYLEFTDLNFNQPITPINNVSINRVLHDINQEGGNFTEFIEWFFDDFCAIESNKKFMPPQINFMCSTFVVNKYLYTMKDTLKMRKKEMDNIAVRNMLLGIALPFVERTKNKQLSQKVLDFSNSKITATKFFDLLKQFANKLEDNIAIEECNKIDANRELNKKK